MAYLNRPDFGFYIAFNADPNDAAATPTWTDLTQYLRSASMLERGRQYELGQTFPAAPSVVLRDVNEYLNADNTSSPYYPNVVPYRQVLWQGMWPQVAGNLLNANMWTGNDLGKYDPSFESYAAGSTPYWLLTIGSGVTPTITTSNPHGGTKSVGYNVTAGGGTNGIGWTVPCMPGRQYTATAYVRQTAANTTQIFVNGGAGGSSTTTTLSYVRLSVTFTATQPTHQIWVASFGTSLTGSVNVDDIQHEPGASASTFTTTGPVIYPIFRGYAERFQKTWLDNGFTGYVTIPLVDAFAALQATDISSEYAEALGRTTPDFLWTLKDGVNTGQFVETSGNNGPALAVVADKRGPGILPVAATPAPLVGDPGAVGVQFANVNSGAMSVLGWNTTNGKPVPNAKNGFSWGQSGGNFSFTAAAWITIPVHQASTNISHIFLTLNTFSGGVEQQLCQFGYADNTPNYIFAEVEGPTAVLSANTTSIPLIADGKPHLWIFEITAAGSFYTLNLYIDNAVAATNTASVLSIGPIGPVYSILLGGGFASGSSSLYDGTDAVFNYLSMWNRALSGTEKTTLWTAGGLGYAGETSGTRITRHLALGGYTGPTRISTGQTTMEAPSYLNAIDLLSDSQQTTVAEQGDFWVAPDGAVVFEDRNDRFLRTTAILTFGEAQQASGETPYQGDIEFDLDPTFIYANVQVSRNNGANALGGVSADINAAIKRYFGRSFSASGDFADDTQPQDMADWVFYTHNAAGQRIAALAIDPAGTVNVAVDTRTAALWSIALGLEKGQRVTVKRRAAAANNGAGITISKDFFIENVKHDMIDMDTGEWYTTFLMSPLNIGTPQSMQPWILEDPVYGVLGTTTKLGF